MPYHQILILADEYMASAIGAVGYETIKTPHVGRLAKGWGYELRRQGHTMASVGKLHFKSSVNDNGYEPCKFGELGAALEISKLDGHQKRLPATVVPLPHFGPQKHPVRGDYAVWFEV